LIEGRVDAAWARWVRPWTLASWCALTIGIAMGSWWAYYTLGWGGWWFWDPVENASFMPWLAGTALIHSSIVVEKRDTMKSWTILLAIITFSLSLVGTFLVRSGVLTSVHAFATDPRRGAFLLLLLLVVVGGSLTLYAIRAPSLKGGGLFAPISREGALVLNNLILSCGCATVFLGTLYPLFLDAVGGPKLSVGFPFFNRTFVPLMVPMIVAVGIGPMLSWKRGDLLGALQRLWAAYIAAALVALIALSVTRPGPIFPVLGLGLAAWVGTAVIVEFAERVRLFRAPFADTIRRARHMPRASYGMSIAHFGLAVSIAGFSASAFDQQAINAVHAGSSVKIAGYTLQFVGVDPVRGANFRAQRATVAVMRDGQPIATMHPEQRFFPLQQQTTGETAIRTNLLADLYVALGDGDGAGNWTLRVYWKPLVPWIWIGAVLMAFGGVVSLSDRRWRVGVVARARRTAPALQPAPGE
jgi:cytochrome c-type biogenesis protein CcmF